MKKLLLLLLIAGGCAYAYWPYHTTKKLEDALRAADKDALDRIVDFAAVRQSLKEQMKAKVNADAVDGSAGIAEKAGAQAKAAAALLTGAVADKVIDSMVTSDAVTRLLKLDQAARSSTPITLHDKTWHTPTKFSARGADNTRFVFRLTGSAGWRVVSIEPGEGLGKQVQLP